jgi:hypothetical protein
VFVMASLRSRATLKISKRSDSAPQFLRRLAKKLQSALEISIFLPWFGCLYIECR